MRFIIPLFFFYFCSTLNLCAQQDTLVTGYVQPRDIFDVIRGIFNIEQDKTKPPKKSEVAILPGLGYNPSFGFLFGITITGGKQFGDPANTTYSAFNMQGSITTKGVITLRARHNIFTARNAWNLQGDWQISRMGVVDYGVGFHDDEVKGIGINDLPVKNTDSAFPMKYTYVRLFEKAYRNVAKDIYVGAGLSFDMMFNIVDVKFDDSLITPHYVYSKSKGFNTTEYMANGIILGFLYTNRDHPMRPYRGVYADFNIRYNASWLGSSRNSVLFLYDFRKYFSLSKRNPEHVLALWHWASYQTSGDIPYLQLPGTANDTYQRSGRGYTFGRYKGPSYAYFESEYRFPITRNKFLSGVLFVNAQAASDNRNKNLFRYLIPAGGGGLRFLFNKNSRTTLCIDYGQGRYGSKGFFFGLNEVF